METGIVKTNVAEMKLISDEKLIEYLDAMGLAQKLSEKEKITFLEIAKAFNLNPFKREIFVTKYKENEPMAIITGYETYIKRAERSGQLDGWNVTTDGNIEDNSLKAIITIHRKDRKHPFVHEVFYSEYVQTTEDWISDPNNPGKNMRSGKKRPTKFWEKAHTMIKKVATAQGFRLCFSDELGGIPYSPEEMPEAKKEVEEGTITIIQPEAKKEVEEGTITIIQPEAKKEVEAKNSSAELQKQYLTFIEANFPIEEHNTYLMGDGYKTWGEVKLVKALNKAKEIKSQNQANQTI